MNIYKKKEKEKTLKKLKKEFFKNYIMFLAMFGLFVLLNNSLNDGKSIFINIITFIIGIIAENSMFKTEHISIKKNEIEWSDDFDV